VVSGSIQTSLQSEFSIVDGKRCSLRNFSEQDLNGIVLVEQSANPFPWTEKNFEDSVSSSHVCVLAEISNEAVGHGVFSIASGDAELLILSVHPLWQSKGVARGLLNFMIHELEDYAAEMFLEVRESNDRAIKLYEGLGFNQVGSRPGYYPKNDDREDAIIYAKSLRIA